MNRFWNILRKINLSLSFVLRISRIQKLLGRRWVFLIPLICYTPVTFAGNGIVHIQNNGSVAGVVTFHGNWTGGGTVVGFGTVAAGDTATQTLNNWTPWELCDLGYVASIAVNGTNYESARQYPSGSTVELYFTVAAMTLWGVFFYARGKLW